MINTLNKKIAFFCDMDGTLLNHDKTISRENLDAIAEFTQKGNLFVVSIGRVIQAMRRYVDAMQLKGPIILCNGGQIYDCGREEVAWSKDLDYDKALAMVSGLTSRFPSACAEVCRPDGIYDYNFNEYERHHWQIAGFTATVCERAEDIPRDNWSKILFAMPHEDIEPFAKYAETLEFFPYADFVTSGTNFHEMLPRGCSKGSALKKLVEIYGLDDYVTAAMGDYINDMEMLRAADIAVCPANSHEDVKGMCDIVTEEDCEHGAVARALRTVCSMTQG